MGVRSTVRRGEAVLEAEEQLVQEPCRRETCQRQGLLELGGWAGKGSEGAGTLLCGENVCYILFPLLLAFAYCIGFQPSVSAGAIQRALRKFPGSCQTPVGSEPLGRNQGSSTS